MLGSKKIPGALSIWTEKHGIKRFPTDGIGFGMSPDISNGEVTHMAYESKSQVEGASFPAWKYVSSY